MKTVDARNHGENELEVCREYEPDRRAIQAALRVVLGLPRVPSPPGIPAASDPEPEASPDGR